MNTPYQDNRLEKVKLLQINIFIVY